MKRITIEFPAGNGIDVMYEADLPSGPVKIFGKATYGDSIAQVEANVLSKLAASIAVAQARHDEIHKSISSDPRPTEADR